MAVFVEADSGDVPRYAFVVDERVRVGRIDFVHADVLVAGRRQQLVVRRDFQRVHLLCGPL